MPNIKGICDIERVQITTIFVSFTLLVLHIVYPMIYPYNNTFSQN